ncbi:hypothetical protein ADL21_00885 [Streptomyces albus subsp. albus]|nr:hypothetical protein ADL21_00885 [Streptomyces albus subsp. albus]
MAAVCAVQASWWYVAVQASWWYVIAGTSSDRAGSRQSTRFDLQRSGPEPPCDRKHRAFFGEGPPSTPVDAHPAS